MSFADVLTFLGDARVAPVSVDERQMRLAGDALERALLEVDGAAS